jgi:hypothetical protein
VTLKPATPDNARRNIPFPPFHVAPDRGGGLRCERRMVSLLLERPSRIDAMEDDVAGPARRILAVDLLADAKP